MRRLSRYLFIESTLATVLALLVLTAMVLLPQMLKLVDLWVNKGISLTLLGQLMVLLVPRFLASIIPMAVLVGILSAMGRLSEDSELVVIKASGISLYQIARPIAILLVLATMLGLWLHLFLVPSARQEFDTLRNAVASARVLSIKEKTFNQDVRGLTLYVNKYLPPERRFEGLLIYDQRNPDKPVTIVARRGVLHDKSDGMAAIYLEQGSRHLKTAHGSYQKLDFAAYHLDLGLSLGVRVGPGKEKIKDLGFMELIKIFQDQDPEKAMSARMEWHLRLSISFATLILGTLAIPLGVQSHRSGRSYGYVIAILVLVLHILILSVGETLAKQEIVSPLVGYWTPNLVMALLSVYILERTAQERPLRFLVWLAQWIGQLPERLLFRVVSRSGPGQDLR